MMIPSVVLSLLVGQSSPTGVNARLVGASLFKNGFAVTQRLIDVPKVGTTLVLPVPQGAMGTLWFTPSEGLNLDAVVVESDYPTQKYPAASVDAILGLNVGSTLTLLVSETTPAVRLTGKLKSATGAIVILELPTGVTRVINKASVIGVEGKGLKSEGTTNYPRRVLKLKTSGKPGRVGVVALERNLTWSPAYAVNLLPGGKELTLVAKATIINDLERLTDLDCRFVTGFPNLPFAELPDPLTQIAAAFAAGGFGGASGGPGGGGGFGGGGFGGQAGGRFENRRQASVGYNDADAAASAAQAPPGEYLGELFFYQKSGVSVDNGGRAAYTLFRTTVPYETIYAWDLPDPAPGQSRFEPRIVPPGTPSQEEIWQTLRFKNNTKIPLTTGPATTFSESQFVGQETLKYASPGQTAELKVTRSLDIAADFLEEETARERGFIKRSNDNYPIYDRVTVRGTLQLTNRKATTVKVRIRKSFTGEWISGEGTPDVKTTAAGLRQPNPTGIAEWTVTLEPGADLKLTYTTRLLVNS